MPRQSEMAWATALTGCSKSLPGSGRAGGGSGSAGVRAGSTRRSSAEARSRSCRPSHGWRWPDRAVAAGFVRALRPDLVHVQDQIHSFHETDAAVRIADAAKAVGRRSSRPCTSTTSSCRASATPPTLVHRSDVVIANDPRNAERCLERGGARTWTRRGGAARPSCRPSPPIAPDPAGPGIDLRVPVGAEDPGAGRRGTPATPPRVPSNSTGGSSARSNRRPTPTTRSSHVAIGARRRRVHRRVPIATARLAAGRIGGDDPPFRRRRLRAADDVCTPPGRFGLPVVTTPPPTAATTIVDGENCLLVREPTADAWADALRRVLTDPSLAARLRAGSLRAADRFSWRRLAENHLEVYERLLSSL